MFLFAGALLDASAIVLFADNLYNTDFKIFTMILGLKSSLNYLLFGFVNFVFASTIGKEVFLKH